MKLSDRIKQALDTAEPAHLGPEVRAGRLTPAQIDAALKDVPGIDRLDDSKRALVRALALLWHDHLDAAHQIVQDLPSADASFIHAIMHRREPDYGNSKYWFRRVGKHPAFAHLAAAARAHLESRGGAEWTPELLAAGSWDPFALVDACAAVQRQPKSSNDTAFMRELQRLEFHALLEHLAGDS